MSPATSVALVLLAGATSVALDSAGPTLVFFAALLGSVVLANVRLSLVPSRGMRFGDIDAVFVPGVVFVASIAPGGSAAHATLFALAAFEGIATARSECRDARSTRAVLLVAVALHVVLLGPRLPTGLFLAVAAAAGSLLLYDALRHDADTFGRLDVRLRHGHRTRMLPPGSVSGFEGVAERSPSDPSRSRAFGADARGLVRTFLVHATLVGIVLFLLVPRVSIRDALRDRTRRDAATAMTPDTSGSEVDFGRSSAEGRRASRIGFEEDAFLSNLGTIEEDSTPALALRATLEGGALWRPTDGVARVRGIALDTYRDGRWFREVPGERSPTRDRDDGTVDGWIRLEGLRPGPPAPSDRPTIRQEVRRLTDDTKAVFALVEPVRVARNAVLVDPIGNVETLGFPTDDTPYAVVSRTPPDASRIRDARIADVPLRFTDPEGVTPRIRALAREVAGSTRDAAAVARRFESHLQSSYRYDLAFEASLDADPTEQFLFETRAGYCVHFASAMLLMLRSLEIPCRMAGGYASLEPANENSEYVFLRSDSHAWVEIPFEGAGWVSFDPTPPQGGSSESRFAEFLASLSAYLDGFGASEGRELLASLASLLRVVLPWTLLACLLVYALTRLRGTSEPGAAATTREDSRLVSLYRDFLRIAARAGVRRYRTETPLELAGRVRPALPEGADAIDRVTARFCEARYGGRPPSSEALAETARDLDRLRDLRRGRHRDDRSAP